MAKNNYIEIDTSFYSSAKCVRLENKIGSDGVLALVRIWLYCGIDTQGRGNYGELNDMSVYEIAKKAMYKGNAQAFISVLTGEDEPANKAPDIWLERRGENSYYVHKWHFYQSHIVQYAEYCEKRKQQTSAAGKSSAMKRREEWLSKQNERAVIHGDQETKQDILFTENLEPKKDVKKEKIDYQSILDYLNKITGRKFELTESFKHKVNGRLKDGYKIEDFKKVIDNMTHKWKGGEFEQYLQPDTLFSTKFDGYLNMLPKTYQNSANPVAQEQTKKFIPPVNKEYEKQRIAVKGDLLKVDPSSIINGLNIQKGDLK